MKLTKDQSTCHNLALEIVRDHENNDRSLVEVLIQAEALGLSRAFELSSLFMYSVKILDLTEGVTGMLINVARKSVQFRVLRESIQANQVTISKAHKFASSLNENNVKEWIKYAQSHSSREIEEKVREQNPDKPKTLKLHLSLKAEKLLKRAQSLESQRRQKPVSREEAIEAALELFIEKRDPVVRADRASQKVSRRDMRKEKFPGTVNNFEKSSSPENSGVEVTYGKNSLQTRTQRIPFTAEQKNAVFARDRGCCKYVNQRGECCGQDHFTEIHHKILVADGGTNHVDNLVTLCGFHHDLLHQLELPLELGSPAGSDRVVV